MKTYLGDYLYSRGLMSGAQCDDVLNIEHFLTNDNFAEQSELAYKIIFEEEPDPIVFTGHKFFRTKVVHPLFSRVDLMEKGLHLFRMMFARHAYELRRSSNCNREMDDNGVVVIENFLPDVLAGKVKEEILSFSLGENIQSHNKISSQHPNIQSMLIDKGVYKICAGAAHRRVTDDAAWNHFQDTTYVQRLKNDPNNGDIQKVCHSDVFYPCLKYWYFPEDVTVDDGPFMYAKKSNVITEEQLDFFYRESVLVAKDEWDTSRNKGHGEGSFRAMPNDLETMNVKLEPITAKANSLVIADTSGFHCRGDVRSSTIRSAVHGAIRVETPFDTYD